LRYAQGLVKELCKKHGLHHHNVGFIQGNIETITCMKNVAMEARRTGKYNFFTSMLW